jgi:membrane protein implicated in regulation of membrane protease activity
MSKTDRSSRSELVRFVVLFVLWVPLAAVLASSSDFRAMNLALQVALFGGWYVVSWYLADKAAQFVARPPDVGS